MGIEHIPLQAALIARLTSLPAAKETSDRRKQAFGGAARRRFFWRASFGPLAASLAVVKSLASGAARASGVQTPAARSSRY